MRLFSQFLLVFAAVISATLSSSGFAADHQEAPALIGRGQLDLNDIYAFRSPGNGPNSVLIMTVNPFAGTASPTTFGTAANGVAYEFNLDTNGDAIADVTYATTFTGSGPTQGFVITRNGTTVANGNTGSIAAVAGGGSATAGLFDDPFFFDLAGFRNGFNFTGANAFGAANISAIVLEVPHAELGATFVRIQGRSLENGVQVDRTGRPAIATALIPGGPMGMRDAFNQGLPQDDVANFTGTVVNSITNLGNGANAAGLAAFLLPDLLGYDSSLPSTTGYFNGRGLNDDVIDISLQALTGNPLISDLAGPDSPVTSIFPYLAPAQPTAVPEPSSMALLATCALGFVGVRRYRRRVSKNGK